MDRRRRAFIPHWPVMMAAGLLSTAVAAAGGPQVAIDQQRVESPLGPNAGLPQPSVGPESPLESHLAFNLQVAFDCAGPAEQRDVVVSIANTAKEIDATRLRSPQIVSLEVPLAQLRWLQDTGLCALAKPGEDASWRGLQIRRLQRRIPAFATLMCRDGGGTTRASTSAAALDVWLRCPPAGTGEDQQPPVRTPPPNSD